MRIEGVDEEQYDQMIQNHVTEEVEADATLIANVMWKAGDEENPTDPELAFAYGVVYGRALTKAGLWKDFVRIAKEVLKKENGDAVGS